MIVSFEFIYMHKNRILGDFLEIYALKSGMKFSIFDDGKKITLFIEGEEKECLNFADNYMKYIPTSVFLKQPSVKVVEKMHKNNFKSSGVKFPNITPSVVYNFADNKGALIENEFGILSQVSIFYSGKFVAVNKDNFTEILTFAYKHLSHYQSVIIKYNDDEIALSADINFNKSRVIIPTNPLSISKMFAPDESSLNALASYEKPVVNLKLNAIFRKNHSEAPCFFDVKLPEDIFTYALCAKLYNDDIFFLCANFDSEIFKIALTKTSQIIINHGKFLSKSNVDFINGKNDKNLALFGLKSAELGALDRKILRVFLSKKNADKILIYDENSEKSFLKISIPKNFEAIKEKIVSSETGKKLFQNFSADFDFPKGEIADDTPNFYTIFEICAQILYGKSAEILLQNALLFNGEKGVRLDFKVENGEFDMVLLIKNAMSYRLAGVDEKLLSFGFIDSLAYFISDFMDDIQSDFGFDLVIFEGTLFENKKLANNVLELTAKNYNAKFSYQYGLEI